MDIIYDDEMNTPDILPKIPMKRNPEVSGAKSSVEFLSKAEREKIHKDEEEKKKADLKTKEKQNQEKKKIYQNVKNRQFVDHRQEKSKRKRSRSREKDMEKKKSDLVENKEFDAIKVKIAVKIELLFRIEQGTKKASKA